MDILTLIPPILSIVIAVMSRNVYAALICALIVSESFLADFNPALGSLHAADRIVQTVESNATLLVFCMAIGGLIALMRDSGGIAAMAKALITKGFASTRRRAELAIASTGCLIFVDTNVSLLSSGVLGRPLYDAYKLSRERLAYIIDSTCAPISVLVLVNAWGAYALSLIAPYGYEQPVNIVLGAIFFNFYSWLTLIGVFFLVFSGKELFPFKKLTTQTDEKLEMVVSEPTKAIYMWLPLLVMVLGALGFMAYTGGGNITEGEGARSILWAIILAIGVLVLLLKWDGVLSYKALQEKTFEGIGEMVPMIAVLLFSIAFGSSLKELGTGTYISSIAQGNLPAFVIPALIFIAGGLMSFMTGTSWGTYGILVPIAMPLAESFGIPPSLALAAVLGGGVFGDHCSPISDTSLIASVASGSEHLDHVKTQLPYALTAAGGAVLLYLVFGVFNG